MAGVGDGGLISSEADDNLKHVLNADRRRQKVEELIEEGGRTEKIISIDSTTLIRREELY